MELFNVLAGVNEILICGDAPAQAPEQFAEIRLRQIQSGVIQVQFGVILTGNGVPRQRIFEGGFAELSRIIQHVRQHEVRRHAFQLRRSAADAIKFADGDFDRAGIVGRGRGRRPDKWAQRIQILNRAFAKGGNVTDDERAAVILQRGGGDFRRGRAETVDEHDERAVVKHGCIGVTVHIHRAIERTGEHDGAVFDEKAGKLDGFFERTAGIAAQIENDAGNFFLFEFFD